MIKRRIGWPDRCAVCGDPIPEGRQVCPICADAAEQADFEERCIPKVRAKPQDKREGERDGR